MKNDHLPVLIRLICSLLPFCILNACSPAAEDTAPNIVIILADDLGYGDLGCYNPGSLVPTPNLDQLAAEGMRMTQTYCPVSVCSPSRYALMTGQYPWRSWNKTGVMRNYERSMIDSALLTLPEMLQKQGYTTAGFGKWHLGTTFPTLDGELPVGHGQFKAEKNGANLDLNAPVSDGPLDHGFSHWYGFSCASECWILQDRNISGAIGHDLYSIEAAPNSEQVGIIPLEDFLPHITNLSIDFLEERAKTKDGEPFFLYFAPYVPHIPLAVSPDFRGRTEAGLYGDYVHELDHYIGRLMETLDRLGMKKNTLVLFASDNGSQFERTSKALDVSQASNSPGQSPVDTDTTGHQPNWPLSGTKWGIQEGGVRTPFIARWPGRIPAGKQSGQLMALTDMLATLGAVSGYSLGETHGKDSYNLLPVLEGAETPVRPEVVVQSSGKLFGIIQGKWKYVGVGNYKKTQPDDPPGALYDLSVDPAEKINLYNENPEIARRLHERLRELVAADVL
ncbi:sulfatase-like hydrolase/transferase [Flavilitoribacter nigricans]|uniref:Sulfatase n=1 Tax=Flavilitoribacter nigricans (strain ATCC 23147 / DSM 23189 / NBRC 102662 / NCIMB 1420 / SS-2) TaxID=1122177 RepID=A0A2D0NDV6_FLAN2|nr:sulfatase-like hydrolase/transferase [Flavilitoribacter nigricans]PHN06665.1 sulfatase [Flavilitoribacter nigricans DSM 23189 = NBRC 102662]